jgi:hypothetical protein
LVDLLREKVHPVVKYRVKTTWKKFRGPGARITPVIKEHHPMADLNEPQQVLAALRTALEQLTQNHDSTRQAIGDMEEAAADLQEVLTKLRRMQVDPEGIAQIQGVCTAVEALAAQFSDLCTLLSETESLADTLEAELEE